MRRTAGLARVSRLYVLMTMVLYIFVKQVIFNKVVTYRLEAGDIVRKCFAKISRRKFLDNLKRATTQDLCRKSSVMNLFNEIDGMNSRLATSVKKIAPPRMFTCEYIRTFRASTVGSCMSSAFLIKFRVVYYKAAVLLRRWFTIDFFLTEILSLSFLNS